MFHLVALNFIKNLTWKGWLLVLAGTIILFMMGQCTVNKVADHFGDRKQVTENNEDRKLRDDLSVKRLETETQISTQERQLNEELSKVPASVPSARRLARACHELRRDGRYSELPLACRPSA